MEIVGRQNKTRYILGKLMVAGKKIRSKMKVHHFAGATWHDKRGVLPASQKYVEFVFNIQTFSLSRRTLYPLKRLV